MNDKKCVKDELHFVPNLIAPYKYRTIHLNKAAKQCNNNLKTV